jgi:hypothetical protein
MLLPPPKLKHAPLLLLPRLKLALPLLLPRPKLAPPPKPPLLLLPRHLQKLLQTRLQKAPLSKHERSIDHDFNAPLAGRCSFTAVSQRSRPTSRILQHASPHHRRPLRP